MVSPQKPIEHPEGADEGGDRSCSEATGERTVASVPKVANERAAHSVSAVPDGESAHSVSMSTSECTLVSATNCAGEEVASNCVPKGQMCPWRILLRKLQMKAPRVTARKL